MSLSRVKEVRPVGANVVTPPAPQQILAMDLEGHVIQVLVNEGPLEDIGKGLNYDCFQQLFY
jgi:hypothetical protein